MERELPKIDIAGTMFYIDIARGEFREVANGQNKIDFEDIYETPHGFKMHFDLKTNSVFRGSLDEFLSRDDIKLVKLPTLQEMDPIGFNHAATQWKQDNPMLAAAIQKLPVVTQRGETRTIGEVLKDRLPVFKKPLIEKKRHSKKKGLRP